MNEQELKHYGVLGMKWGVRKSRVAGSKSKHVSRKKSKYPDSDDHKEATRLSKKNISSLSNEELRILNNRKQLERQYYQLNMTKPKPSHIKRGLAYVAAVDAGLITVLNLYTHSDKLIKLGRQLVGM